MNKYVKYVAYLTYYPMGQNCCDIIDPITKIDYKKMGVDTKGMVSDEEEAGLAYFPENRAEEIKSIIRNNINPDLDIISRERFVDSDEELRLYQQI